MRLERAPADQGLLDFASGKRVAVALQVPDLPVAVLIKDAPGATIVNQQLLLELDRWTEICFTLEGTGADRAPVELYHPDGVEEVEPCRLAAHFEVLQVALAGSPSQGKATGWEANLPEAVRKIFVHLERFGSITEAEVGGMLGGPREARKFTRKFDEYVALLPFHVSIEVSASGKRYLKI